MNAELAMNHDTVGEPERAEERAMRLDLCSLTALCVWLLIEKENPNSGTLYNADLWDALSKRNMHLLLDFIKS